MRKCKYKRILDRDSLQTLFFSYIIPAIEYAGIICDHIPENLSLKIENIQQKAARIVTGEINKHHKDLLYIETDWIPLYKRREDHHHLIQLSKIYHNKTYYNKTQEYLHGLLQSLLLQVK